MDPEKLLKFSVALKCQETHLENISNSTWQKKRPYFLRKNAREYESHSKPRMKIAFLRKKRGNREKQSPGEQVKTRRGAETLLSLIFPIKMPKPRSIWWKTRHRRAGENKDGGRNASEPHFSEKSARTEP